MHEIQQRPKHLGGRGVRHATEIAKGGLGAGEDHSERKQRGEKNIKNSMSYLQKSAAQNVASTFMLCHL